MRGSIKTLFILQFKRRVKDGFAIGYNIIFPMVMILLLGYLFRNKYGTEVTSFHYYVLVSIPFCTAMGMITAAYSGKEEAYSKTAARYLAAPIEIKDLIIAKLLAAASVLSVCNTIVFTAAIILFRVPAGKSYFPVLILLTAESVCIVAIGLWIGMGMKNFMLVKNIMNIPIGIFGLLGGAFFPFGTSNGFLQLLIGISPVTWINRSLFLSIYDKKSITLWCVSLLLIFVGACFTIQTIKNFKKEEFIYGDLPGYGK